MGSIYPVTARFDESVAFYEKLLAMEAVSNSGRFAQFEFEGHTISLMNGLFDVEHADAVEHRDVEVTANLLFDAEHVDAVKHPGMDTPAVDDLLERALAPNTQKFALNFWVEDLRAEHERLKALDLSDTLGGIKYVCFTQPYFYFDLTDPDGNVIEVTGAFTSAAGTFSDGGVS